jgi:hypothetical protein
MDDPRKELERVRARLNELERALLDEFERSDDGTDRSLQSWGFVLNPGMEAELARHRADPLIQPMTLPMALYVEGRKAAEGGNR